MSPQGTVPKPSDQDVLELLRINALTSKPQYVPYMDMGYQQRFCHISAKHCAMTNGGKRVHGWALWRFDVPGALQGTTIVFAEHHSVWQNPEGELIDVTPSQYGSSSVLFVRDDNATIQAENGNFLMRTDLTNCPDIPRVFRGAPTDYEFWPLSYDNHPAATAYAQGLGFDLALIVTDDAMG